MATHLHAPVTQFKIDKRGAASLAAGKSRAARAGR